MHVSGNIKHMQMACLVGGLIAFGVSAVMAWRFGASMSTPHGVALVVACFAAAVIVPMKRYIAGFGINGRTIQAATVFFLMLEFLSHLGYTFGMRDKLSVEAGAQTVAYEAVQDNLKSEKANVDLWRKQLEELTAQNAWSTSVTADALRAQLANANLAIDLEAKRKGCKEKCLARTKERDDLAARIAVAERVDDLNKRIEATQRVIDSKVQTATTTKVGHSVAKAQTAAFAEVGLLFTTLDADAAFGKGDKSIAMKVSDYVIGVMMAIGATVAPSVLLYFALFTPPGMRRDDDPSAPAVVTDITPPREGKYPAGITYEPQHVHTTETVHIRDKTLRAWALSDEVQALIGGNKLKAA